MELIEDAGSTPAKGYGGQGAIPGRREGCGTSRKSNSKPDSLQCSMSSIKLKRRNNMTTTNIKLSSIEEDTRIILTKAVGSIDLRECLNVKGGTFKSLQRVIRRHGIDSNWTALEKVDGKNLYILTWTGNGFVQFKLEKGGK